VQCKGCGEDNEHKLRHSHRAPLAGIPWQRVLCHRRRGSGYLEASDNPLSQESYEAFPRKIKLLNGCQFLKHSFLKNNMDLFVSGLTVRCWLVCVLSL